MKHTWTISELSGINRAQAAGDYIEDYERDFLTKGVVAVTDTLYNDTTGTSGAVSAVTDDKVTAAGMAFKPGDFYRVSITATYVMQNSDGPLIEVECNICGWSYPAKDLVRGRCKVCIDKPKYAKS
jgi:hypothetical protein